MLQRAVVLLALVLLPTWAAAPGVLHVNEARPGQKLDLTPFLVKGHYTVFEFRSVY